MRRSHTSFFFHHKRLPCRRDSHLSERQKLTGAAGSKADIPKNTMEAIRKIEELFTIDTAKLKAITDHFISELAKGMCCAKADQHYASCANQY